MTYMGWASLCLPTKNLERSKAFYLSSGFELISEVPGTRAILASGNFRLALMPFLDDVMINIRGGEIAAVREAVRERFPEAEGEAERYTKEQFAADADGVCWLTADPDGRQVLFDTHELEQGETYVRERSIEILEATAKSLEGLGAPASVVNKIRTDLISSL